MTTAYGNETEEPPQESIQVEPMGEYFVVTSCVRNYMDINNQENTMYNENVDANNKKVYNEKLNREAIFYLLSKNYIQSKNVTVENLYSFVKPIKEKERFYPLDIKKIKEESLIGLYKINGIMQNLDYTSQEKVFFLVSVDYSNTTFSIEPMTELEYNQEENVNRTISRIEINDYNLFGMESVTEQTIALEYLAMYKFLAFANPKYIYDKMPEEYRVQRFGTLENYAKYIQSSKEELMGARVERYTVNKEGQYIITDQYQNEYVFKSNNIFDFSVTLDVEGISNTNNF